jgi:ribonuclease-3
VAGEARRQRLRALAARAGVRRIDVALLEEAFVHESAVREGLASRSNERLEFLGDAVLGFAVARWLFERYPDADEGELALRKASLVSDLALAESAAAHDFEALMTYGAGLAKMPPARRSSALADAFEAWIAALFRVAGFEAAERFVIEQHLVAREAELESIDDPKTVLQEWTQRRYARTPVYEERFEGPPHERVFFASVSVEGELIAHGEGSSKKRAQRAAAKAALAVLQERHGDVAPRVLSSAVGSPSRPGLAAVKRVGKALGPKHSVPLEVQRRDDLGASATDRPDDRVPSTTQGADAALPAPAAARPRRTRTRRTARVLPTESAR